LFIALGAEIASARVLVLRCFCSTKSGFTIALTHNRIPTKGLLRVFVTG
jgi:hypothetical protein